MKSVPFRLMVAVLVVGSLLMACASPTENKPDAIVGTWNLTTVSTSGVTVSAALAQLAITYTFKSDKTFTSSVTSRGTTVPFAGTWSGSGGTYSLVIGGQPLYTASVNGSTLTYDETSSGTKATYTFTKS